MIGENTTYTAWEPREGRLGHITIDTDDGKTYAEIKDLINWYFDCRGYRDKPTKSRADEPSVFDWLDIIKHKKLEDWPRVPEEFTLYSYKGHIAINVCGAIFGFDADKKQWHMEGII